jgi:predicted nucleic-acid-binding protein
MASLDTSVVVRLIVGDDPKQAKAAEQFVASEACTIVPSVLMETEWVLRAGYGLDAITIASSIAALLELQNINASEPAVTQRVLEAHTQGFDFADALHAIQSNEGDAFATFDKKLVRTATKRGLLATVLINL